VHAALAFSPKRPEGDGVVKMSVAPSRRLVSGLLLVCLAALSWLPPHIASALTPSVTVLGGETPQVVAAGRVLPLGPVDSGAALSLNLGLPLRNRDELVALLDQQSRTKRAISNAEFDRRFAPNAADVQRVEDWARQQGFRLTYASPDGLTIAVRGTAAQANTAFRVRLSIYREPGGRIFFSADSDPTVPADLGLQSVSGLSNYDQFHPLVRVRPASGAPRALPRRHRHSLLAQLADLVPSGPNGGYTPADLRGIYNMTLAQGGSGQTIGFTLWGTAASSTDLSAFASYTGETPITVGTGPDQVNWQFVNNNTNQYTDVSAQTEVAMDLELAHGMAPHSSLKYYLSDCSVDSAGNCNPSIAGLESAISIAANDTSLKVVSNSWAGSEPSSTNDPFYTQTDQSFMHAASIGTTFYFASGDDGASSGGPNETAYPADDPYVVAVGATSLYDDGNGGYGNEIGWSGSGGGCSILPIKGIQAALPGMSCTTRAVPDISAVGDPDTGAYVYVNGTGIIAGGSSLSTALLAGMEADTNEYMVVNYQPPLYFYGWLYDFLGDDTNLYTTWYHDVTCGYNGYSSGVGWDPVTGLGSENWLKFSQVLGGFITGPTPLSYQWSCQNTTETDAGFHATACVDQLNCYAVGDESLLEATHDGGMSWIDENKTTNAISCPATSMCYSVGNGGNIIGSNNGGTSWSNEISYTTSNLLDVSCPGVTTCYAVGDDGTIVRTTDGTDWFTLSAGTTSGLTAIACPGLSTCYAVGDTGTVLSTSDGANWTVSAVGLNSFYDVSCPVAGSCYAVGSAGTIARLAGGYWTTSVVGTSDLAGVSCPTTTSCVAVGGEGTVLTTADGFTWISQNTGLNDSIGAVACPTTNTCFAVGDSGLAMESTSAGSTWTPTDTRASDSFGGISCPSTSQCFIVSDSGTIMETTDGTTWSWLSARSPGTLNGIACPSTTICYAVGDDGSIINTTDGLTWNLRLPGDRDGLNAITCTTTYWCIAVGNYGTIWWTGDSGNSWNWGGYFTTLDLFGVACSTVSNCFIVGDRGTVLVTTDGGSSWNWANNAFSNTDTALTAVSCPNTNNCYAVGSGGAILATSNGGASWSVENSGVTADLAAVSCQNATSCHATGDDGTTISTADGSSWQSEQNPVHQADVTLAGVSCRGTTCYAVGDLGLAVVQRKTRLTDPVTNPNGPNPTPTPVTGRTTHPATVPVYAGWKTATPTPVPSRVARQP
jgi:photosystem II stability/assembly factor-like uncharacterized protein